MNKRAVKITKTGYLPDSPDRFNDMNIIPSNKITMKDVKFPILGTDDLGNQQMMMPGGEYEFPGEYVTETPMGSYQNGGAIYMGKYEFKDGGLVRMQEGGSKEMPLDLPLKEQNIYLLPEYNQPVNPETGEILPDMQRPNLGMDTGATEYKTTVGYDDGDVDIPTIVAGQYIGDKAVDRYELTGERFKTMDDPSSYSKFYDEMNQLGLMQQKNGGSVRKVKIKSLPRNTR